MREDNSHDVFSQSLISARQDAMVTVLGDIWTVHDPLP